MQHWRPIIQQSIVWFTGEHQLDANVMFKHLKIGTLKPTTMTLQMTDHSHKSPIEIIENVSIKVKDHLVQDIFLSLSAHWLVGGTSWSLYVKLHISPLISV